jgi:hypothetical protein
VEINNDAATSSPASTHTLAPDAPESFAAAPPLKERPVIHPVPPSRPAKRKREDDPDDAPANFNRVRIKAKRRRLNKIQPDILSSAEKRKSDDAMEIDEFDTSLKRHKSNLNEGLVDEHSHLAKSYHQKNQQAGKVESYTSSTPDLDFNKVSGNKNPTLFSSPSTDGSMHRQEPATSHKKQSKASIPKPPHATEEDAKRAGIPAGYSLKNWDPTEEPIMLLGSVFDANSLGKWIYDWTVFHHGAATPLTELAGELWLLLIQLAGKVKRAEEIFPRIRRKDNQEMVEDFLESGERLWIRFAKLLKVCEDYMWKAAKQETGEKPVSLSKNSGIEFVESMFGKHRELEKTEKMMRGIRLWNIRFDANCEEILRYPSTDVSIYHGADPPVHPA